MMHFNPTLRLLHRAACRLLLFAWVALAPAMTEAQAAAPSLEIASSGSRVSITPSDASFSERELQAIRSRIEARLRESPLRDKADVRVTLRGDTVRELQARLRRAGPSNAGEIDAFLDQSVERAGSEELTPPIEFSIGRDFTLAGADARQPRRDWLDRHHRWADLRPHPDRKQRTPWTARRRP